MKCICGHDMVEAGRGVLISLYCGWCKRNRFTCLCGGELASTPHTDYLDFKCRACGEETNLYPRETKQVPLFGGENG